MKLFIIIFALLFALPSMARQLSTAAKLSDFEQFIGSVEAGYGPFFYKIHNGIYDYDKKVTKYRQRVKESTDNADFYYTMLELIASFKDGHFNGYIDSDYKKSVPLATDLIQGKVLITKIDRNKLDESKFPFSLGDEIVRVDGKPVADEVDFIAKYIGSGFEQTVRRKATWTLVSRRASRMPVDTKKDLVLSIRKGTSELIEDISLDWDIKGTPIDEAIAYQPTQQELVMRQMGLDTFGLFEAGTDYSELSNFSILDGLNKTQLDSTFACSGGARAAKPKDAVMIMTKPFVAYYYPTKKGNIGYLRIPHYAPKDNHGQRDAATYELRYSQYEYAVAELEKNTVALVIDQDDNCGGSVSYLESILGLFMLDQYKPMQFELLANRSEIVDFRSYVKEVEQTMQGVHLKNILTLIEDTWKNTDDFLTTKTDITGQGDYLQPNHIRYTKPILMLIDEISGSGGDAFPGIMGFERAKLLGTRTSGLGGHVEQQPPLNFSRIKYRMTKSLFFRAYGVAVENNGAVPHINYDLTREDIMYEYKPYRDFYTKMVLEMVPEAGQTKN